MEESANLGGTGLDKRRRVKNKDTVGRSDFGRRRMREGGYSGQRKVKVWEWMQSKLRRRDSGEMRSANELD